jgi:hypothetical protein
MENFIQDLRIKTAKRYSAGRRADTGVEFRGINRGKRSERVVEAEVL